MPANVPQPRTAGLAILDADLKPVVATPGLPDVGAVYRSVARRALSRPADRKVELMLDPQGDAVMVAAVPISAVPAAQDLPAMSGPSAWCSACAAPRRSCFRC